MWESVLVLCFAVRYFMSIILMGKRELGAPLGFSSWCLLICCVAFPRGAMGLSLVCDCGIS